MRQKALPFLEAKLLCTRCTVTVLAPLLGLRYAQQVMSPTGRYAALPQGCMILKHARTYRYLDTYAYAPHPTHGPMAAAAPAWRAATCRLASVLSPGSLSDSPALCC